MDILHASLMNGISSHVFDFDDTHLKTVIHPAGPVVSALLALVGAAADLRHATFSPRWCLGSRSECRIGNAVYPAHYDRGWHITGTAGVFGAAAACGELLGLTEQQMVWALGLAATQPVGLREMFGSMTKSLPSGTCGAERPDRGAAGVAQLHQHRARHRGQERVGQRAEHGAELRRDHRRTSARATRSSLNTYKPFACGIVIHPDDRCLHPAAQRAHADGRSDRAHRSAGASAGPGIDGQEDAADRPREQVQRLLRGRARDREGIGGHARLQR